MPLVYRYGFLAVLGVFFLSQTTTAREASVSERDPSAETRLQDKNARSSRQAPPAGDAGNERSGIAVRYPEDANIESDESVLAAVDFEDETWKKIFNVHSPESTIFPVRPGDKMASFEPFRGRAIAIKVKQNAHYGGSLSYLFSKQRQEPEPDSIYFRYYLRFGEDWDGQGGKLPGFGGTYDRAGWGGQPSDGFNGWSARGSFGKAANGKIYIATYCYHADMKGQYGSVWRWDREDLGVLERNRWYCIEQYLHLNSPRVPNGEIRGWIDGRLAFEKSDIKFRNTDKLRIEKIWFNVYHGGKEPAQSDDHLFIDNIVIADRYIGPLQMDRD